MIMVDVHQILRDVEMIRKAVVIIIVLVSMIKLCVVTQHFGEHRIVIIMPIILFYQLASDVLAPNSIVIIPGILLLTFIMRYFYVHVIKICKK